jgi:hypothetical protein
LDNPGLVDDVRVPLVGRVELVLSVDLWDGSDHRQLLLQEKLNRYVEYVLDGDLRAAHPTAAGRPWAVVIESAAAPDARTAAYVQHADLVLRESGGGLELRQVESPTE